MSVFMAILSKVWPYLLAAAIAGYGVHRLDSASYARLQAIDAADRADREAVAAQALRNQIADRAKTDAVNAKVIEDLKHETDSIAADRNRTLLLARRLLADAGANLACSGAVSQTGPGPGASGASGTSQNESIIRLLADAHDECERNADRLDALIAEIKPQL